jgi:hypothetical protein
MEKRRGFSWEFVLTWSCVRRRCRIGNIPEVVSSAPFDKSLGQDETVMSTNRRILWLRDRKRPGALHLEAARAFRSEAFALQSGRRREQIQ